MLEVGWAGLELNPVTSTLFGHIVMDLQDFCQWIPDMFLGNF